MTDCSEAERRRWKDGSVGEVWSDIVQENSERNYCTKIINYLSEKRLAFPRARHQASDGKGKRDSQKEKMRGPSEDERSEDA